MADQAASDSRDAWRQAVHDELHRLADIALNGEAPGHSLQPTLLANDAYLKLLEQRNVNLQDRSQVLAVGGNIIRRLLVDYARLRKADKRGGKGGRGIPLHISTAVDASEIDILDLDEALTVLAKENKRAAQVVELKFFGGLSGDEIASELDVSLRTINNDWRFAKAWLYRQLGPEINENSVNRDYER